MIRVLIFFAILFAVTMGFAWMSDLPGVVSISWQGYVWEKPPVIVGLVAGLALIAFLLAVWIVLTVLRSPKIATRFFKRRRKDKGYEALSSGLIALGTGNAKQARRHGLDADRLLNDEPATKLLLAQTAQLAGRDEEARERFEAMLEEKKTRALGLHGLFIEAERQQEPVAARHYAEEAAREMPGLEWAGKAVLGYQAVASHWEEALKTLERNYTAKMLDKKTYRRHRAVVLTALAQNLESGEPDRAYSLAKEAHGLALDLVPAAALAARLATRKGEIRKASKLIESTWRVSPHPDLAEAYAHVRSGDSAVDRLKRVKSLAGQRANTNVGAMAVARAALDAREFDDAREQLKKVLRSEPVRGAFLMMAELEEAEHGDRGRMRDWLSRAVHAPLDKAWIADGVVSREWQAVSPVTGKLDAFDWKTPSGFDDDGRGDVIEDAMFDAPALPVVSATTATATVEPAIIVAEEAPQAAASAKEAEPEVIKAEAGVTAAAQEEPAKSAPSPDATAGYEGTTDDVGHAKRPQDLTDSSDGGVAATATSDVSKAEPASDKSDMAEESPAKAGTSAETATAAAVVDETEIRAPASANKQAAADEDLKIPIELPFARMPDDPGLDDDEDEDKPKRPRFFN
ncbi:heme biosynthesis HemY N-terminal domain-containing protein [Labrenzia sp. CE80]|uniref:heme biosynthesis protein HemY n=1 Tax=Labrenzia sp. CE80 TaxID=1788986 RepID=UPI00129A6103|nr:heme biosynthesis HemY N-terminal domain-containing protein [Labrenzia sp. CE80]